MNEEIEYLTIVNEDGTEEALEIIFTFTAPNGKDFVICGKDIIDENGEEGVEIYSYIYVPGETEDSGELFGVEEEEDLKVVQEMIDSFFNESDEEETE